MHRHISFLLVLALIAGGLISGNIAQAQVEEPPTGPATLEAGYGEADATWHVGAGSGQYSDKTGPADYASDGYDPHGHSTVQQDSHGVQSRLSFRAIVVDDGEDRIALVKSDNYLAMDALLRRAGQILAENGSSITHADIFHMGSHNHYSPYYSTPSWGVWLFQDIFDIRAYEYQARQMAAAILDAEGSLAPATMGATTVEHNFFKGQVQRRTVADDGTPGGYPSDFGDFGLSVLRFDRTDPNNPGTIGTLINWGMHPEGLDNDRLITAEWLAGVERYVGQATGGGVVIGQGDVGSAESGPAKPYHPDWPKGIFRQWDNAGHAQVERGAWLLSQDVIKAWEQIGSGNAIVPTSSDIDVEAGNAYVPGPLSHPYPSVSNCRTETTIEGDPGAPVLGLPDCARGGAPKIVDNTWETLRGLGLPLPDHYDAPSFTGVQENLRLRLQAFKLGEVILMSCACEAQVDLVLNLESRTNEVQDDMYLGYDWTKRLDCTQPTLPNGETDLAGDWTCSRKSDDPAAPGSVQGPYTFTDAAYDRMWAQIYNDARGWDAPENAAAANVEPTNPDEIWGNFTHEELPQELGYKLPIAFGNAGEYNGYTVSYREYMAYDEYRKALTPYGPHTADYMNTRLTRLAGQLSGGPALPPEPHDVLAQADEQRQVAFTTALGALSSTSYDSWRAALPDDAGEPAATAQPEDIKRFDAAVFSWRGGSNAVDNPFVKVQRNVDGAWVDFAGQQDEVQTMVKFPSGPNGFADTYSGGQEWIWTANFEAFNAFPAAIGSTPAGTYRFVADGLIRQEGEDQPYQVTSEEFEVDRWDGVQVSNFAVSEGAVSFDVVSDYPDIDADAAFPYVRQNMKGEADRGELRNEDRRSWCDTCSFRPWAATAGFGEEEVTLERADGTLEKLPVTCTPQGEAEVIPNEVRTYSCTTAAAPAEGERLLLVPGDVTDFFGETTAACIGVEGEVECPTVVEPTPTPTDDPSTSPSPTDDPSTSPSPTDLPTDLPTGSASPTPSATPTSTPSNGGGNGGGNGGQTTPPPTVSPVGGEPGTAVSSITSSTMKTKYQKEFTLSGEVTGDRACNITEVELFTRGFGTDEFVSGGLVPVGADGMWSSDHSSKTSASYAVRPVSNQLCEGQMSTSVDVLVKAKVNVDVLRCGSKKSSLKGRVFPNKAGSIVKAQIRKRRAWKTVARDKLDGRSRYRFRFKDCDVQRVVWPKQDVENERGSGRVTEGEISGS